MERSTRQPGVTLSPEFLQKLATLALTIHHGQIVLHLNGERDTVDVEHTSRERIKL